MRANARVAAASVMLAMISASGGARAQTTPLPAEAFANLPAFDHPHLSPDGKHFAVIQSSNGRSAVQVYPVNAPGATPIVCNSTDTLIENVTWAGNNRLLIQIRLNQRVNDRLYTFSRTLMTKPDCSDPHVLFAQDPLAGRYLPAPFFLGLDPGDPNTMFMEMYGDNRNGSGHVSLFDTGGGVSGGPSTRNLYRVSLKDGSYELWQPGSYFTIGWSVDGAHVAARVDMYKDRSLHVKIPLKDDWKEISSFNLGAEPEPHVAGLTSDGTSLAIIKRSAEGTRSLYPEDLKTGSLGTALFTNSAYDMHEALYDDASRRVIGVSFADEGEKYVYFDPARTKLQRLLEKTFPAMAVTMSSSDQDGHAIIVRVDGGSTPPGYYYFEPATMHASAIGSAYPDLAGKPLGTLKSYVYTARDGTKIPGYLTIPPGREAKGLPMVVLVHGGPDGREILAFDWRAQFLASRGYAVFQPNYRGSAGYGSAFTNAGIPVWNLRAQDDITDGVKKLIADGVADPKRICIAGEDYGGYAALAGAAFVPDLYACAIGVAPVTDLRRVAGEMERGLHSASLGVAYWNSRIGDPEKDRAKLDAASPALHADAIKIPVLLMHGRDDTWVPIDQSLVMQSALQSAGKNVTFVQLNGDDHYLEFAATRLQVLSELEKFLKANIGR
ncbi:MAG TPA: alpha/beta fold hydrolase [Rhizomicrobium sp.]|jgi:dipeptidyl aminopeptidase/acylaminoacyl peptidase